MNWRERILADPTICHGRPCVRGTRVLVSVILDNLADGETADAIAAAYAVSVEDVRAVLAYAAENARETIVRLPGAA